MFQKLRQSKHTWNHKRVYRVYCELRLNLRRKPKKRLPVREKIPLMQPERSNVSWSMDFMSDALMNGKRFRTMNILDDYNREVLGIKVSVSLPSERVVTYLEEIANQRGYPIYLRLDNGPENISKVMKSWAELNGVKIRYIQPGKPAQNAYIERFNRTYRQEVLDLYLFKNVMDVQVITDEWLYEYNHERPHESLKNLSPINYKKELDSTNAVVLKMGC